MTLSLFATTDMNTQQAAAIQAACQYLLDFSDGSVLRAIIESNSHLFTWMQQQFFTTYLRERLANCVGPDVDSFVNDFGLYRVPANAATGVVTFARFSTSLPATIPLGTNVVTTDGTQTFTVIADTTQPAYNASLQAYTAAAGVSIVAATVQAAVPGTGGNVVANAITLLSTATPGIDYCYNTAAFSNGTNKQSDAALIASFALYINSRSLGVLGAIQFALSQLGNAVSYSIIENQNLNGTTNVGNFVCVVDDGSGAPNSTFLANAYAAVNAVRAFGTTFQTFGPTTVIANVSFHLSYAANANTSAASSSAIAAVTAYIQSLTLGQLLPISMIAKVAYGSSPYITNVTNILINNASLDIGGVSATRILCGNVASV